MVKPHLGFRFAKNWWNWKRDEFAYGLIHYWWLRRNYSCVGQMEIAHFIAIGNLIWHIYYDLNIGNIWIELKMWLIKKSQWKMAFIVTVKMSLKKMSRRPFSEGLSCEPRCSNCTTPPFSPKLAAAGRQSWQNIDNIKNIEKYWKHWQNIGSCSTILTKYWKHWQNIDSWSTILAKHYICAVFVNSTNITTNIERAVLYIADFI